MGLALDRRNFSGFHHCFQAPQVLTNDEVDSLVQEIRECIACAERWTVLDVHFDQCSAAGRSGTKIHAAVYLDVGFRQRMPGNMLIFTLVNDFGVPVDRFATCPSATHRQRRSSSLLTLSRRFMNRGKFSKSRQNRYTSWGVQLTRRLAEAEDSGDGLRLAASKARLPPLAANAMPSGDRRVIP